MPSDRDLAQQYPEELVELVARVLPIDYEDHTTVVEILPEKEGRRSRIIWGDPRRLARSVLDALSSAGRLVPEGSEVREEWGVRYTRSTDGQVTDEAAASGRDMADGWVEYAEQRMADATAHGRAWVLAPSLIRRRAITTPWTPAEPAQRSGVAAQEKP